MRLRQMSLALLILAPLLVFTGEVAFGAQTTTVTVDADLVRLLKAAIYAGGAFLLVAAGIGLAFFGWDVRNARTSILDAVKEATTLLNDLKSKIEHSQELMEKLEQLGAQLEEVGEARLDAKHSEAVASHKNSTGATESEGGPVETILQDSPRTNIELIRSVIASGSYEWTTIGRVINRTGLSREQVLEEVRKARCIKIAKGKQTHDYIFKLDSSD